jgi:flagellar biosynthesis protein FlhG
MASQQRPVIIPVASGKGGVGKSVFAASLAMALARQGQETVAVDLDLGGANLHTYLGLANSNPGVGDYLKQKLPSLQELIVPTSVPGLRFLPGDGKTPFMANIPGEQRFRLLDELQKIPSRFLVVDLGAGSSVNTLNLFGLAHDGIILTTLDTPALMNALVFLRNFIFASILSLASHQRGLREMLLNAFRRPAGGENLTVEGILRQLAQEDRALSAEIRRRLSRFCPRFVYNMADQAEDLRVAPRMAATLQKNLSLSSATLGLLYHDPAVRRAVRRNEPFLAANPESPYARGMAAIVGRLLQPAAAVPDLTALMAEARRHA